MAQTTWSNPAVSLGSSYAPCVEANQIHQPVHQDFKPNTPWKSAWAPPGSIPSNIERERERDRLSQPARPYQPPAYSAPPYSYPPPNPNPPIMFHPQQNQSGPPYGGQQFFGPPLGHQQPPLGQQQPPLAQQQPPFVQQPPLISSFGQMRHTPSPPVVVSLNRRPGDWDCPKCQAHNFATRSQCYKCTVMKPGGVSRRPGDWWCGRCNGHNYAYRVDCFKCSADKSEGKSDPDPTMVNERGNAKWAGDWTCPKCNAHCFASRMECFKCEEPKPIDILTDVECSK